MCNLIFTIDFDNTCALEYFPEVGPDVPFAANILSFMVEHGHKLILWTMRTGEPLQKAIKWFSDHNIELWGVNDWPDKENVYIKEYGESRKIIGDFNIDDRNLGCPTISYYDKDTDKYYQVVDWVKIQTELENKNLI